MKKETKQVLIKSKVNIIKDTNKLTDNDLLKRWGISKANYQSLLMGNVEKVRVGNIAAFYNDMSCWLVSLISR